MSLRYLVLVFNDHSRRHATEAEISGRTRLRPVFANDHFVVMTNGHESQVLLPENSGVIIGTLFQRAGPLNAISALQHNDGVAISENDSTTLVKNYWGSYIAATKTAEGARIIRAPIGTLPCYYIVNPDLAAFSSDAATLRDAGLLRAKIDWNALRRYLYARDLPSRKTAIEELCELLPGNAVTISGVRTRQEECWNPWDYVASPVGRGVAELANQLRTSVERCTLAWASSYDDVLLGISGGLDSSIVAAVLAKSTAAVRCLTMVTEDPSGDEREYARIICRAVDADLAEVYHATTDVDIRCSVAAHRPRPCGRTHELAYHAAVLRTARANSSKAFFTGNGGDNVFYNSQSARAIVDRYLSEGFSRGLAQTVRDICSLTGCSAWQAGREALRIARATGRGYRWRPEIRFLHADLVKRESQIECSHPWLESPPRGLPGKAAHIAMLLRMQHHLEGYDRDWALPVVNPLVSQPVVELCLSVQSWEMCRGGVNRSVARTAFSDELPNAIVNRRSKGGPDSFALQILDQQLPEIRTRVLGGQLASRGLLDIKALEQALSEDSGHKRKSYASIMSLLDTEAWIEHWNG